MNSSNEHSSTGTTTGLDNGENKWSIGLGGKLPIGFGMELAANEKAMNAFTNMTELQKQQLVERSKQMHTKNDMIDFVTYLGETDQFQ